ncbi:hypothetical protein BT69DRAFT_1098193 [Atractiella rhizophila]|nr:hypothetical protein BT69DRAFT_1098193 [Atractiella rhizophila]
MLFDPPSQACLWNYTLSYLVCPMMLPASLKFASAPHNRAARPSKLHLVPLQPFSHLLPNRTAPLIPPTSRSQSTLPHANTKHSSAPPQSPLSSHLNSILYPAPSMPSPSHSLSLLSCNTRRTADAPSAYTKRIDSHRASECHRISPPLPSRSSFAFVQVVVQSCQQVGLKMAEMEGLVEVGLVRENA